MSHLNYAELENEFASCQKLLTAFGDEVRQRLLMVMLKADPSGVRVAEIAAEMKLTPPAVSHHMQILKDAGIVHCRKEGKFIFYYFDSAGHNIDKLLALFTQVKSLIAVDRPDRTVPYREEIQNG